LEHSYLITDITRINQDLTAAAGSDTASASSAAAVSDAGAAAVAGFAAGRAETWKQKQERPKA
jgi:hypothetical protein